MDYFLLLILFLVVGTLGARWITNRTLSATGCGQAWRTILSGAAAMLPIVVILALGGAFALVYLFFPIATLVIGWIAHWTLTAAGIGRAWRMVLSWIASMLPAAVYTISVYPHSLKNFLQGTLSLSAFWIPFLLSILSFSVLWIPLLLFLEWRHSRKGERDRFEHSLHL